MAKKILIVEDDPLLVRMYQTKFIKEGYEVLTAGDGMQGLDIAQNQKPDFVIMDVMMPRLSGLELLEELRKNTETKNLPVIMLSNLSQPEQREKALQLGVKEFLLKANYTPSQIAEKVRQYLG
ncbi:MAG: response regulator [Patescibacteria group bacterium]|jgi:two-component system alkaline phosphatase synthesis response regulator PhoP